MEEENSVNVVCVCGVFRVSCLVWKLQTRPGVRPLQMNENDRPVGQTKDGVWKGIRL